MKNQFSAVLGFAALTLLGQRAQANYVNAIVCWMGGDKARPNKMAAFNSH